MIPDSRKNLQVRAWLWRVGLVIGLIGAIALMLRNGVVLSRLINAPPSKPAEQVSSWMKADLPERFPQMAGRTRIAVFSDYYCPACQKLEAVLRELQATDPHAGKVEWFQYPAISDGASRYLAELVECAARQDRFESANRYAFRYARRSRALLSIDSFAGGVGIPNLARFQACMADGTGQAAVQKQAMVATRFGIPFTPLVVIGQDVYKGVPNGLEELLRMAQKATIPEAYHDSD